MPLTNPLFRDNERIGRAAQNAPAMSRGERNHPAVAILQNALIGVGAATMRRSIKDGELDGKYGTETVEGVKRFQVSVGLANTMGHADGIAGRNVWRELDRAAPQQAAPISVTRGTEIVIPPAETPTTTRNPPGVRMPTPTAMIREYRRFRDLDRPGKPCDRDITHQCAIRMSVALMRCDIGFHFNNPSLEYTHQGGGRCGIDVPHNAGAQRLFDHMRTIWHFTRYRTTGRNRQTWREIAARCVGRPGLIFFKDLAGPRRSGRGDHIDYWDGQATMNDLLNYNADDERSHDEIGDPLHFFRKATEVFFLPLRNG